MYHKPHKKVKEEQKENLKTKVKEMKSQGMEWSEIEDWITRQVGYNREVIQAGREIFVNE